MSVSCYAAGLPIVVLTILLTDLKIPGICIGLFAYQLFTLLAFIFRICRLDIAQEIENAMVRVDESAAVEQDQVVVATPVSLYTEGISEFEKVVATARANEGENGAPTHTDEEEENGATTRTNEESEDEVVNTKHSTEQRSATKDAKWIISSLFGAVLSFLIFSTISFIK